MKNLHISGLNLSLLILLSVASWSVPAFSMKSSGATTSMTFAQYISAWNQYEKSVKSGAPEATLLQPIESDLSSVATPNAGALNFIAGKLGVSKDKATDKAAVLAALQVKIAAGGTATGTGSSGSGGGSGTPTPVAPTPVTPAPAPAPTPVTPAPAPAPKVSGAASAPAPAAQDLADLLSKLPNTASWATGTTGEAEFKKLIDDLKAHTGTAASLAAGGGLTPADVANAVAAAEAVKDTAHASAQGTWASEKSSLKSQLSAAQAAAATVTSLTGERDAAQAQVASLRSDLANKETERAAAVSALAAAQAEVASKETERATAAGQVAGLQSQVASKESERAAAESSLAAAQSQVTNLTSEKTALQAQVDGAVAAQSAAVASAVAGKDAEISTLRAESDNSYQAAQDAINVLADSVAEADAAKARVTQLEAFITSNGLAVPAA